MGQRKGLSNVSKIIFDFDGQKSSESLRIADTNFNVISGHLAFESFFQCENCSVDGIFQL